MIQEIILGVLFVAAVIYVVNVFRKQAKAKSTCGSATCKCEGSAKEQKANS